MDLCIGCQKSLPIITHSCAVCARPLMSEDGCNECSLQSMPFEKTIAAFSYDYPLTHLVQNLKFQETLIYGKILGKLLAAKLNTFYQKNTLPELIVPVPLHTKRLKERGFNQAVEIAKPIAKHFNLPIDFSCKRIKFTKPQAKLSASERMKNLHEAFQIPTNFRANTVAIVDDVITTGFTIQAFALALKNAGVTQVDVWCVARARL